MTERSKSPMEGQLIDDRTEITIVQLCRRCAAEAELIERMIANGIIEPSRKTGNTLYFPHSSVKRTHVVMRLRSDLGVNLAGAALALELMDRIEELKSRVKMNASLRRVR